MTITDRDKLVDSQRELAMRKRLYPQWVAAGRMSKKMADRQIAIQEAIVQDYIAKAAAEAAATDLFNHGARQ